MKKIILLISAIVLIAFASLTFYLSSSLIFDLFGMREKQGNDFVEFVAWANLMSSAIYFVSGYGLIFQKKWTTLVLSLALGILAITFLWFNFYINAGGIHLEKTFGALIFRMSVTLVFIVISYRLISRKNY